MLRKLIVKLVTRLWGEPLGFSLVRADEVHPYRIRGDLIPADAIVIVHDGRSFVRTGELDDADFEIYREGHKTHTYRSWA